MCCILHCMPKPFISSEHRGPAAVELDNRVDDERVGDLQTGTSAAGLLIGSRTLTRRPTSLLGGHSAVVLCCCGVTCCGDLACLAALPLAAALPRAAFAGGGAFGGLP